MLALLGISKGAGYAGAAVLVVFGCLAAWAVENWNKRNPH